MTRQTASAVISSAAILAGCNDKHFVLAPRGPIASQIASLSWVLLAAMMAVMIVVTIAIWLSVRGSPKARSRLSSTKTIVVGGIVFPLILLSALLTYSLLLMRSHAASRSTDPVRIEVVGEQWWWRVRYLRSNGQTFERANEIRIPIGQEVTFSLKSADVIHSFWIPSLGGKVDMIPGRTTALRLIADRPGIFRGACAEYCGGSHAFMSFDVISSSKPDFESWLSGKIDSPPFNELQRRGQTLFEAAGCGACHAIDGTPSLGVIGPNLTDLGARRSIGAGRLPMTEANLRQFIASGQHLKPGIKMPPFAIFAEQELNALTAYLMGLK